MEGILERRAETFKADGMAEGEENLVDGGCSILRSDVPGTGVHEETMGNIYWMVDSAQMVEALNANSRVYLEEREGTPKTVSMS